MGKVPSDRREKGDCRTVPIFLAQEGIKNMTTSKRLGFVGILVAGLVMGTLSGCGGGNAEEARRCSTQG